MQLMEQLSMIPGDNTLNPSDSKSLKVNRDRLIEEKAKLATELSRIQNLLKLQVDIDKQSSQLMQREINNIQYMIKTNG